MAQCQHDGCTCNVHGDEGFCGDECRNAQNAAYCSCPHEGCGGHRKP